MATTSVVCTCTFYGCRTKTFTNEWGRVQAGQEVSPRVKSAHNEKDKEQPELPARAKSARDAQGARRLPKGSKDLAGDAVQGGNGTEAVEQSSESSDNISSLAQMSQSLSTTVHAFGAWLHHVCGLSRESTNKALKIIKKIVTLSLSIGYSFASVSIPQYPGPELFSKTFNLPVDVRTAVNHLSIDPCIRRSICCPKCYTRYELDDMPVRCTNRQSPRSPPCKTVLWTTRTTNAGMHCVPARLYCTQDFESWLEFFLSRPGIEDLIDTSYAHRPNPDHMQSVWDSPAWSSLGPFAKTPGNLTFSYYIDWFNPFTNKIAGKTASCGAIMFFCLNLPYELQHLPENTFFAGITPPPKEPDVVTITALQDPIIKQFEEMWSGKRIRTFLHPDGTVKRVAVLPGIGDLLGIRKGMGFAGVGSNTHFCSFCKLHKKDINSLDLESFVPRIGVDVRCQAQQWQDASTKKAKKEVFDKHGVRWSSLHNLVYRDPVKHTILGLMHNWIEGILQFHTRSVFGIGIPAATAKARTRSTTKEAKSATPAPPTTTEDVVMDVEDEDVDMAAQEPMDIDESLGVMDVDTELQDLHVGNIGQANPRGVEAVLVEATSGDDWIVDDGEEGVAPPIKDEWEGEAESDDQYEEDAEHFSKSSTCLFNKADMARIHACISSAVVPSWVARPPSNLGEKTHGKLKADQWLILFTVYFPLILPEILSPSASTRKGSLNHDLLHNFAHLVAATNLVCSHSTSISKADAYTEHYIEYRRTLQELFPHITPRPNHHFALHNGDLMKFWGPLIKLSEFPFEHHNGRLQRINTNNHMWQLDLTMLRNMCRRSRLLALYGPNGPLSTSEIEVNSPAPFNMAAHDTPKTALSLYEAALFNGKGVALPIHVYNLIRTLINSESPSSTPEQRHFLQIPHPPNAQVYPTHAVKNRHISLHQHTYSARSSHPGNSCIAYAVRDANGMVTEESGTGFIDTIWRQVVGGRIRTFVVVVPHQRLAPEDEKRSPYTPLLQEYLHAKLVSAEPPAKEGMSPPIVIMQEDILGHVPFYRRPPGTFGIKHATLVIVDSLRRERTVQ